jgi:hypothetical protein
MRVQLSARERRRQQRRRARKPSALIRALTSAALALPGVAGPAAADSAPTTVRSDYRFSRYAEDPIEGAKVAPGGEKDRYEIDIHQFRFESGLGDRVGLGIDVTHETMSGATPWYVTPDENGDPVQVMTGATIDERRTDALVTGSYYLDRGKASLGGGISSENDYFSFNANVGGERQFNEKNTTLSGGVGGSWDTITPSGTREFPNRVDEENKQAYNGFLALGHVLGRATIVQTSVKYQFNTGFLSDPYKLSLVAGIPETDERPDQRHQISWLTRFRHHFKRIEATLHLDYMLYADDWNMNSHTIELAWYQTLFDRLRIVPSARYYSQGQADFYAPFYTGMRSDGLRSSDYRLSPFGAYSYRVEVEFPFDTWDYNWEINAAFERYVSGSELALESVDVENPGLVSFNLFTVGLTARF